jgi:hypothetical protein
MITPHGAAAVPVLVEVLAQTPRHLLALTLEPLFRAGVRLESRGNDHCAEQILDIISVRERNEVLGASHHSSDVSNCMELTQEHLESRRITMLDGFVDRCNVNHGAPLHRGGSSPEHSTR